MDFDDRRISENIGSQRGMGLGGGGGLGGMGGLLFGLVASRFGIGGIIVLAIGMFIFGGLGSLGGGGQQAVGPGGTATTGQSAAEICASDPVTRFSCQVLGSTEDVWSRLFQASGQSYQPAELIFYEGGGRSGCGAAQSAMGPFYCPTDQNIYLDTGFFRELQQRFGAPGDFAQAYVIAHEVGHHVQRLTGTLEQARIAQARMSEADANAVQVQVELQADCYAGVWAAAERAALEPGDIEEGMRAAEAIGDDTLQRAGQGYVVPESFTHGSAAQRQAALQRGLRTGDPAACQFTVG